MKKIQEDRKISKQLTSQRYVYKIHSARLRRAKWDLTLSIDRARENKELISISESQMLRFIDELNGVINPELYIKSIKRKIKKLRFSQDVLNARAQIKELYQELDQYQFKKDYVCIVIDSEKDYRLVHKRGFKINGITFRRLLGTTGGIKGSTIVFVNELLLPELKRRINNGRDMTKEFSPAKLEAYMALVCSASTPVSMPQGIVVVHDCITHFKDDIIELDDTGVDEPRMRFLKDHEIELNASDGFGMGSPSLMERWGLEIGEDYILPACVIRNAFCKGSVVCVDFVKFAKDCGLSIITDIWGNTHSIDEIELVLTESMLKLWDSYSSIDDYLENCISNHYTFAITKTMESDLENVRTMNYQFLQSYDFTDEQIEELISPTVKEIRDILSDDYRKTILYVKGAELNERNVQRLDGSFATALMIEKEMWNDPYIQDQVHSMIRKRIDTAKVGVLTVPANYSLITGDPYALCQSMFGLEVTGLLKGGEVYSKYWIDHGVDRITSFRAPMTSHNNIRLLKVVHDAEMDEFYKYITTPTIFNCWDTCAQAMNGFDFDGDCVINTNFPLIVNNTRQLPAICCVQRKAPKCIPSEDDLMESNIMAFGNEVGTITNRVTSMFEVQSHYPKGSREYNIMDYRIRCGQLLQQNAIDSCKGIEAKPMPDKWYSWISNRLGDSKNSKDKKNRWINRNILADKKPYFMQYIYPHVRSDLNQYLKKSNEKCLVMFSIPLKELLEKDSKTIEEQLFVEFFYHDFPVGIGPCVVNRICWRIEEIFNKQQRPAKNQFDYTIMRSEADYSVRLSRKIEAIYKDYLSELKEFSCRSAHERIKEYDNSIAKSDLVEDFKRKCFEHCPNPDVLCNILLDLCYSHPSSKKLVWDVSGDIIVQNLLRRNQFKINFPVQDPNGDFEFGGLRFAMKEICLNVPMDGGED